MTTTHNTATHNRQVRLAGRPTGLPSESHFELASAPLPEPGEGEVLVRVIWLSLDPYMRGRMMEAASYIAPVQIGEVMTGGAVGEVVRSNAPGFAPGDIVEGLLGWQEYAVAKPSGLTKVERGAAPISTAVGVLGMPGITAYFGVLEVARPKAGETFVVSAAAGAVGQIAGQIAKILDCRVVGIAGSDQKIDFVTRELGFDAGINYAAVADIGEALAAACPDGIDVYFDNVGGAIYDAVMGLINVRARIAVCGQISQYNRTTPELAPRTQWAFIRKRARMEGFLVFDYAARYGEARQALAAWLGEGRISYREDVAEGLENAPRAFIGMLEGKNFGKQLVRVGADPA